MIKPVLKDQSFMRSVQSASKSLERLNLWWLGQSGFLVRWGGFSVLLDPYLSDSLTEKYAQSDRPHVRMTEIVVDPTELGFVDLVTSSHNHTDHLDHETLIPIMEVNRNLSLIIPEANRDEVAERLGCDREFPIGLEDGVSVNVGPISVTGIAAAHETVDLDEEGRCRYLGYVVQLGPWTVYHAGDTVWHEELEEQLNAFAVDLALLPINGRNPERGVAGNLNGREAARLAKAIDARLVIPCHFEMFEFNTVAPDEFIDECERLGQPYRILRCGERWSDRELEDLDQDEDLLGDRIGGRSRSRSEQGEFEDY